MAAPRVTQFIALRNLARHAGHQQVRSLHMTGPATYASTVLSAERPILNLPRDIAGLRAECKRRKIEAGGSKQDLISRLNANELATSRAFSSIAEKARPSLAAQTPQSPPQTRHFNTSRALKAVNDTSTIDFAFLPEDAVLNTTTDPYAQVRVPVLPTLTSTHSLSSAIPILQETETPVMRPTISTMSADSIFAIQPMSEISDCHSMHIDFHAVADQVTASLGSLKQPVEQQAGLMRQIFGDMLDDVLGLGKKAAVK